LKDGAVVAPHRPRPDIVALALVLLVFGGIAWIAGSKYTVEGWVIGLNLFATWLGIDSAMPTPRGVLLLFLIVGVGLVYSLVDLLVWRASAAPAGLLGRLGADRAHRCRDHDDRRPRAGTRHTGCASPGRRAAPAGTGLDRDLDIRAGVADHWRSLFTTYVISRIQSK